MKAELFLFSECGKPRKVEGKVIDTDGKIIEINTIEYVQLQNDIYIIHVDLIQPKIFDVTAGGDEKLAVDVLFEEEDYEKYMLVITFDIDMKDKLAFVDFTKQDFWIFVIPCETATKLKKIL